MTERGGILFEDSFDVEEVNPKGKSSQQFNNVARIFAKVSAGVDRMVLAGPA
jgi:hypothetical protein